MFGEILLPPARHLQDPYQWLGWTLAAAKACSTGSRVTPGEYGGDVLVYGADGAHTILNIILVYGAIGAYTILANVLFIV